MPANDNFQELPLTVTQPTICVTAPARLPTISGTDTVDEDLLEKGFEALEDLGWNVVVTENLHTLYKGFAGEDAMRARSLIAAFEDPEVDVVLGARGGYGTTRLLDLLPWKTLAESPAVFVGLSDLTAINLGLMRHGRASWQGPVATYFARNNEDCRMRFMRAMTSPVFDIELDVAGDECDVEGQIWGGNLSMLVSLLGTDYFPTQKQFADGILYIEDVNEPAWRIERMLNQLIQAGVLTRQQVLIVGSMIGHDRWQGTGNAAFKLEDALDYVRQTTGVKIVTGLPFGHVHDTLTLPVGVNGRVMVKNNRLRMTVTDAPIPTEYPKAETANAPLWWV
ncbi:MAG: LD-carboxypeptidase [Sutterellaceae bacterium]|nr:LD-carboxypeptidase [Sutterellaceae bacterium]